jgi:hypothetical protein
MHFLRNQAYAFGIVEESHAQGFAFALTQLQTDAIQNLLVLRAQNDPHNVFSSHSATSSLYKVNVRLEGYNINGRMHRPNPWEKNIFISARRSTATSQCVIVF